MAPIAFDIYFESVRSLKHPLTWRIVYIGQASNDQYDQILEEAEMDCEVAGRMTFTLEVRIIFYNLIIFYQGSHPDVSKLPTTDIVGVTAILLTCSYKNTQEFFRVGYYVNNAYSEEFPDLIENPPNNPDISKLTRHILVEKPRVTKFQIDWEENQDEIMAQQNVGIAPQIGGVGGVEGETIMAKGT